MSTESYRLEVPPIRRLILVGMPILIGLCLANLMLAPAAAPVMRLIFFALFVGIFWLAYRLWQTSSGFVVLDEKGLIDHEGTRLCLMEEIAKVERGVFAFKPTNGFVITLHQPHRRGWMPGLWWRFGKKLGVGGATSPGQTKALADILTIKLTDPA